MKNFCTLLLVILFVSACQTVKNIAPEEYRYLPYEGSEVLYLSDSTSTDSIRLCGYFNSYALWGSGLTKRQQEIRCLRCADLNEKCESQTNRFLAYLFYDEHQNLGIGININIAERKYRFAKEILVKDSASSKQHVEPFDRDVLVIKSEGTSNAGNIIDAVYWDLQKGMKGLKLSDGRLVRVESVR